MEGYIAKGFERVGEQFETHLKSGEEQGASFCATHNGEIVVDVWGGHRDVQRSQPWEKDTLALFYSVTKGLAAAVMLHLHEAGVFSYDTPVAEIWPEFGQNGKERITIRTLMNHRGGLAALDKIFSLEESVRPGYLDDIAVILAKQKPLWTPEQGQAYHATTFGLYVRELFRRLCDQPFQTYFREHIAEPLGADVWVGIGSEYDERIAEIKAPSSLHRVKNMLPHIIKGGTTEANVGRAFLWPGSLVRRSMLNPALEGNNPALYNQPEIRRHPVLWGGGVGTARGLAKIYAAMANDGGYDGVRLFKKETLEPLYERQGWSKQDGVLGKPLGWSQGFLKEEVGIFSPTEESFGHAGLGGSLGWADPVHRVSIGYVTNTLDWRVRSPRCMRLCKAVFDSVEDEG